MEVHFQILVGTDFPKWILSNISKFSYSFLKNWVPFLVTEKLLVMVSYASLQLCNYASIQVCILTLCMYAFMLVCKYASKQVCTYVCIHVCKYVGMQECKIANMYVYLYAHREALKRKKRKYIFLLQILGGGLPPDQYISGFFLKKKQL